jgi:predicted permease
MHDLRLAARVLATERGFAAAAILSLAIGIGANTALFSVTNALVLRPLPYPEADRLAILWNRSPGLDIAEDWFSTAQYFDIKNGHGGFDQVAIALGSNMNLTGSGDPERVGVIRVSSNLLPMLGARPIAGRLFEPVEDAPGRALTAVLNYGTWQRRFGGDPAVVGRSITLNGQNVEIAGVLPASFSLPRDVLPTLGVAEDGEIFLPLPMSAAAVTNRGREDYNVIGRLKRGVTVAQAQAEMDGITARLRRDFPDVYPPNGGLTFSIVPLLDQVVGGVRRPLAVLTGAVGFVLLIACANVANLLLSRAVARRREIAVRAALGATRARIVRQLLTESVLLALFGGALGVVLALAGISAVQALQPVNVPRLQSIALDLRVLGFTAGISLLAGVLFGLAPAWDLGRVDVQRALKDSARGSSGGGSVFGRQHGRRLLVVAELALSTVLLIGAGLLLRSFVALQRVDPGFDASRVFAFELTLTGRKYAEGPAALAAYRDLWRRLDALPGVESSGGVTSLPLSGFFAWGPITVEGRVPPAGEKFINADMRTVGGRYFETMRIPLVRGRLFDDRDTPDQPRAIVIDDRMAADLWPGDDPIGKRIKFGDAASTSPWETVVGVVGRVKQYALDADARIALYRPQTQSMARSLYVTVRTAGDDPSALLGPIRGAVRDLDPDLPIYRARPMTDLVDASLARQRFSMILLAVFAGVALVLAVVGVYGVMASLVSHGIRELGIRVALGAAPRQILAHVLRAGAIVGGAGVVAGILAAMALSRAIGSLLFGVPAGDPLTFAVVACGLGVVALAASFVPARRAARVDPMISLRSE